jgi:hypothetical protein
MAPNHVEQKADIKEELVLPDLVISPIDINRLKRELDILTDLVHEANIRQPNTPVSLPRSSRLLEEFGLVNKLNWQNFSDCQRAALFLGALMSKAPVIHISFAVDPSATFMTKLIVWFRTNIHPLTLLSTGLQPNIAAGCVVRTTNHVFDFSLRRRLSKNRQLLLDKLHEGAGQ